MVRQAVILAAFRDEIAKIASLPLQVAKPAMKSVQAPMKSWLEAEMPRSAARLKAMRAAEAAAAQGKAVPWHEVA